MQQRQIARRLVAESRAAQGLPPLVQDRQTLRTALRVVDEAKAKQIEAAAAATASKLAA